MSRPRDDRGRFLPALQLPDGFVQVTDRGEPATVGPFPAPPAPEFSPPLAGDDLDDPVDVALFGAGSTTPKRAGVFRPYPVLELGEWDQLGAVNRQNPQGRVVLDDVTVSWGTDQPLAQADPASASVSLLDFTRVWGARADLLGRSVTLRWQLDALPQYGVPASSRVYFRGRVTDVALTATSVLLPSGVSLPCTRVDLTCASLEADLANVFPTDQVWPEETMGARLARLRALASKVYVAGLPTLVEARDFWMAAMCAADDQVATKSARDLLLQFFNSCGGDRMVYNPARNSFEHLYRRALEVRSFGMLTRQTDTPAVGRAGSGVFAKAAWSLQSTGSQPSDTQIGQYLPGAVMEYAGALTKSQAGRITRAVVRSVDTGIDGDPARTVTRINPKVDEGEIGSRAVTLDSVHGWNSYADLNADDLLAMATQEGSQWAPTGVRWDTRRSDGFELLSQVSGLLRGYGTAFQWFVQGSWFAGLGVRPVFSVLGGSIAFRDGFFVLDFHFGGWAAVGGGNATPTPVKQHPITWEEIGSDAADRILWTAGGTDPRSFHESVTYEDLRYVGYGYLTGSGVIGDDKGYDEIQ